VCTESHGNKLADMPTRSMEDPKARVRCDRSMMFCLSSQLIFQRKVNDSGSRESFHEYREISEFRDKCWLPIQIKGKDNPITQSNESSLSLY